jgi:hypothetical protein
LKTLTTTSWLGEHPSNGLQVEVLVEPEPILTLDNMKMFLRVDHSVDDAHISNLITSVTKKCEDYCGRAFGIQTRRAYWEYFGTYAVIPYPPHIKVESVERHGREDWESVEYHTSGGTHWKIHADRTFTTGGLDNQDLRVTYRCGYEDVPGPIINAIMDTVVYFYQHRGEVQGVRGLSLSEINLTTVTKSLLEPYRVYR